MIKNDAKFIVMDEKKIKSSYKDIQLFEKWYKAEDESLIYVKNIKPENPINNPVVIIHGLGMDSGDFADYIHFAQCQSEVYIMDIRSQGGQSTDLGLYKKDNKRSLITRGIGEDNPYYHNVINDLIALCNELLKNNDVINIYGGSQGGGLAIILAGILKSKVSKIAIAYPFLTDIMYATNKQFGEYDEVETFLKHNFKNNDDIETFENVVNTFDGINYAPDITASVLMAISRRDLICPYESQLKAYDLMKCEKRKIVYYYHGHEKLPGFEDEVIEHFYGRR